MSDINNKRITYNTLFLYLRMILVMGITFYSSRVVFQALGVSDYGLYNVVGGVIIMLGFIDSSLSGSSSRYITYYIGIHDFKMVNLYFRCIKAVSYLFSILILIIAETIGLWFVCNKLVIPENRFVAAMWVYQCSIALTIVALISMPYKALIIAHEKMKFFAYVSIFENILKLFVAFFILYWGRDRLILYAFFLLLVQVSVRLIYHFYSNKEFKECISGGFLWDVNKCKEILGFTGWILYGNLAVIGYTQGLNILLNIFFGPVVNAARAISVQIQSLFLQFCNSFQMATKPQLTKLYAIGDFVQMHRLLLSSSRLSFFLLLLIAIPVITQIDYVLYFWLGDIPMYTSSFVKIMFLLSLDNVFSFPLFIAIEATGKIKNFQIIEGSILLLIVPISYIVLKFFNGTPESVFWVYLIIEYFTQFIRILIVYTCIKLSIKYFFKEVFYPCVKVLLASGSLSYILVKYNPTANWIILFANSSVIVLIIFLSVFIMGLKKEEKQITYNFCINTWKKLIKY